MRIRDLIDWSAADELERVVDEESVGMETVVDEESVGISGTHS